MIYNSGKYADFYEQWFIFRMKITFTAPGGKVFTDESRSTRKPAAGTEKGAVRICDCSFLYYLFFVSRLASPSMILALAQGIRANQVPAISPSG